MGLATYPDHGDSVSKLIDEADKALYDAKENGRNQVRVAGVQRCADPKEPGKDSLQDRART
jgi:predicted signal transduction protein with EAL and GGDEF domain